MSPRRPVAAVVLSVLVHLAAGTVGLPVAFFVAYAFALEITPLLHAMFLVVVAVVLTASTGVSTVLAMSLVEQWRPAVTIAGATALVVYGTALAVGTVVSLAHEDQNSVTADQPDLPFLLLVAVCLVVAAIGVQRTVRALGRDAAGGSPGPPWGPTA